MLTVQFVTARTTYAYIPSNDSASVLSNQDVSTIQNQAQASLDRFLVDNCLGMPPRELASCRNAIQAPTIALARFDQAQVKIELAPTLVDNCLGMPPKELASCRNPILASTVAPARFDQVQSEIEPATTLPARFDQAQGEDEPAKTLVEAVRRSTDRFKNVDNAKAAGYGLFHGCVSGPQEGAMGIHFVNGDLVGDGVLDPMHPEALLYESKNGRMQLSGVEYIVFAEAWHANNEAPPVLMGQLMNYNGSPNRYGIPAFYELHVWAWKTNPLGTFVDWNPNVSCDSYFPEDAPHIANH